MSAHWYSIRGFNILLKSSQFYSNSMATLLLFITSFNILLKSSTIHWGRKGNDYRVASFNILLKSSDKEYVKLEEAEYNFQYSIEIFEQARAVERFYEPYNVFQYSIEIFSRNRVRGVYYGRFKHTFNILLKSSVIYLYVFDGTKWNFQYSIEIFLMTKKAL